METRMNQLMFLNAFFFLLSKKWIEKCLWGQICEFEFDMSQEFYHISVPLALAICTSYQWIVPQFQVHLLLTDLQNIGERFKYFSFSCLHHDKLCLLRAPGRHCRRKEFSFLVPVCFYWQTPMAKMASQASGSYSTSVFSSTQFLHPGPPSWACNLCSRSRPYDCLVLCCHYLELGPAII